MEFYIVFAVPLVWLAIAKLVFKKNLDPAELGVQGLVSLVLAGFLYWIGVVGQTTDYELINGQVVDKKVVKVSCEHSYSCNCVTTCSGGKHSTCSTVCQTCYDHSYDKDWRVYSNVGTLNIDRVDRQGLKEPRRWSKVKVGEPFTRYGEFTNWIKASPDTVFNKGDNKWEGDLPAYPKIVDYYRVNQRVILDGKVKVDYKEINGLLNTWNSKHGPKKQVNIIAVVTDKPHKYFNALQYHWLGGKKNDVIMVFGLQDNKVDWQDTMTYGAGMSNRYMINSIQSNSVGSEFTKELMEDNLSIVNKEFTRVSESEFEYLEEEVQPSVWFTIIAIIINLVVAIGLSILFSRRDFQLMRNYK